MNRSPKQTLGKVLLLVLNFAISYAILRLIIEFAERVGSPMIYYIGTSLYALAVGALFVAYYILNGFTFENRDRGADELPARWSDEKKAEYIKNQPERRAKAKRLLLIMLPVVITMFVSYIELWFFS